MTIRMKEEEVWRMEKNGRWMKKMVGGENNGRGGEKSGWRMKKMVERLIKKDKGLIKKDEWWKWMEDWKGRVIERGEHYWCCISPDDTKRKVWDTRGIIPKGQYQKCALPF